MPHKKPTADFVLASESPRREKLLKRIVADFRVVPSRADEGRIRERDPIRFAVTAAVLKARTVGHRFPSSLILAADTVVFLDGEMLGKPRDRAEARRMLEKLSGRRHGVVTAAALFRKDKALLLTEHDVSFVTFKALSAAAIEAYLETNDPLDKAGGYAIQKVKKEFVEDLEGGQDTVIGLPVRKIRALLRKFKSAETSRPISS